MIWALVLLVLFPFLLAIGFATYSVGRKWLKDPECPWWLRIICWVVVIVCAPTDPVMNWTWANFMFWPDLFRKKTFTSRVNYYFDQPDKCPNKRRRNLWARLLNMGDEGHIDTHGEDVSPGAA